jgi:hypothetical protein
MAGREGFESRKKRLVIYAEAKSVGGTGSDIVRAHQDWLRAACVAMNMSLSIRYARLLAFIS